MHIYKLIPVLAVFAVMTSGAIAQDTYESDVTHAHVGFEISHMVISKVKGNFDKHSSSLVVNKGKLESVNATIEIGSINTRNEKRDKHLRQPDFFDAEKYPSMTFTSTAISGKKGKGVITGDLTIRDVTKSVQLPYKLTGPIKDPYGNTKIGLEASGEIDRSEFGLTYSKALESGGLMIGNEVTLDINMEFAKK